MTSELRTTPLHQWHTEHGGRLVDFAGWSMPVQYSSIVTEHKATRTAAGVFDISHMGRLRFAGTGAVEFLESVLTRGVRNLKAGQVRYALVTNQAGGILDDVLVYCLAKEDGRVDYALVVNASNREKLLGWFREQGGGAADVGMSDETLQTAMIAVQGPLALELVPPVVTVSPAELGYYTAVQTSVLGRPAVLSRTGYTGEDGYELTVAASVAGEIWNTLLELGRSRSAGPAGLGARDTLRLEAGMPLYGHELSEQIDPFQAGLKFAVQLKGREFVGHAALESLSTDRNLPRRVGLELEGRRIPRQGYPVCHSGEKVGAVTSGTFSPTLERPIAMAYLRPEVVAAAPELAVDVRGRLEPARLVSLPFYQRSRT